MLDRLVVVPRLRLQLFIAQALPASLALEGRLEATSESTYRFVSDVPGFVVEIDVSSSWNFDCDGDAVTVTKESSPASTYLRLSPL